MVPRALDFPSKTLWCSPREMRYPGFWAQPSLLPHSATSPVACLPPSQTSYLQLVGSHFEGQIRHAAGGPTGCIGRVQFIPDGVSVHLRGPESGPASSKASPRRQGPWAVPSPWPGPQGQGAGQTELPPQCPPAPRQGLLYPQSQHDVSFPASVHITSPHLASTLPAASRLPPRSEEGAWRYLGGTWGLGQEQVLSPSWLCSGPAGRSELEGPSAPLSSTQGP